MFNRSWLVPYCVTVTIVIHVVCSSSLSADDQLRSVQREYSQTVLPLLKNFCGDCHTGDSADAGFNLDNYQSLDQLLKARKKWRKVEMRLAAKEMPPKDAEPLSDTDHQAVMQWLDQLLHSVDCTDINPGQVTLRRLNRTEYRNTIRDLLKVDFEPAADFPGDDVGYGFDNIAEVISLPPILMEKYLAAAEQISAEALVDPGQRGNRSSRNRRSNPSNRSIIGDSVPDDESSQKKLAEEILERLASNAFRRTATSEELQQLLKFYETARAEGDRFEAALRFPLQAILVSPHFLFKIEAPVNPGETRGLNDFELATSLSYFLWSTMPDEPLFRLASDGKLKDSTIYREQFQRMLADPKSSALVDNFVAQWLQLPYLESVQPDPDLFPGIDSQMRDDMITETKMLVRELIRQDAKITDLLSSDFTFVNERLAGYYGIADVEGKSFRKVSTTKSGRIGLLTHASILTLTSNPTRTSPVKRGKWIMENLLGEEPPPPDPAAMALEEQAELTGTVRERLEQHRADPNCAVCHTVMDELGFALENYDAVGRWRDKENGSPIDSVGLLPDGTQFSGALEMQQAITTTMRDQFVRCLIEKTLIYATGRGLEYYDECAIDTIAVELARKDYRISELFYQVAISAPFLQRRGETK